MDLKIGQTVWHWSKNGNIDLKESKVFILDGENSVKLGWLKRKKSFLRIAVGNEYATIWLESSEVYTSKQDALESMQKKLNKIACTDVKIPESCYLTDCEYRILADILVRYRHNIMLSDSYIYKSDYVILEKIQQKILNGLVE